jgi:hypothetical protein
MVSKEDYSYIAKIAGNAPNEIWSRTGQIGALLSIVSLLGFGIAGLEQTTHKNAAYAPYVTLAFSFFALYYGGLLRKIQHKAKQRHELAVAEAGTTPEPTKGDVEFMVWFRTLKMPISDVALASEEFNYDSKRTKGQLLTAMISKRAQYWVSKGDITKLGGYYDIKDSDRTVMVGK